MPQTDLHSDAPVVTIFQEMSLRPGRYIVSAILADPQGLTPRAMTRAAELAKVPRGAPFLIGPILGHSADKNEEQLEGPEFEPMLAAQAEQGEPLEALTLVCVVDADAPVDMRTVGRSVSALDGSWTREFDPVSVRLPGNGVQCHEMVDRVVTSTLDPGRYEINAFAESSEHVAGSASVPFTIEAPAIE